MKNKDIKKTILAYKKGILIWIPFLICNITMKKFKKFYIIINIKKYKENTQ